MEGLAFLEKAGMKQEDGQEDGQETGVGNGEL